MSTPRSNRPSRNRAFAILAILVVLGSMVVVLTTAQEIDLGIARKAEGLSASETAYYEYVAPRLDRLVVEVDDVVVMVEGKSRDILALTTSATRIERLTEEIADYGESHGVPDRFRGAHDTILQATDTATYSFDQAREALRTFDFSRMTSLVTEFQHAASELHRAQAELGTIAGGTEDA